MNSIYNVKSTLLTSTISLVLMTISSSNYAQGVTAPEQCAGVVKAGMNDCASSEHACAGLNTEDGYESDWVWLPSGTCNKISDGHIINSKKNK